VPVILPKVLPEIGKAKEKVALIVMDGMSLFDFEILSRHLDDIAYETGFSYALIPTMTPVSRQSLLSGKYPAQLLDPFSLTYEKKGFVEVGKSLGYQDLEICFARGHQPEYGQSTRLMAVIINEIDDLLHSHSRL